MALYYTAMGGTFLLIGVMLLRRAWEQYPAFFAYLVMNGMGALALWPLLYRGNQALYNERAWYLQIIAIPFLAAAVGELFEAKWAAAFLGSVGAGTLALMLGQIRLLVATGLRPAAIELAREFRLAVVGIGLMFAVATLFALRKVNPFKVGLLASTTLGALGLLIRSTGPERYLSTAGWMVALVLWIGYFSAYLPPEKRRVQQRAPHRRRTPLSYFGRA